jgi:hypothetical protein
MACNCMAKKKKKVVETSLEEVKQNTELSAHERFAICSECEHYGQKYKVCEKLDCADCKGSVIPYLSTVKNHCPIEKW